MAEEEGNERREAEWIAEALTEIADAIAQPVSVPAIDRLAQAMERIAGELGLIRLALEELIPEPMKDES